MVLGEVLQVQHGCWRLAWVWIRQTHYPRGEEVKGTASYLEKQGRKLGDLVRQEPHLSEKEPGGPELVPTRVQVLQRQKALGPDLGPGQTQHWVDGC